MSIPELAVTRKTLRYTAAFVWATAGGILLGRAVPWLAAPGLATVVAGVSGLALGVLKSRLVFIPMAARNMERIEALSPHKERISVFAFQAVHSYILIAVMITLGIVLRHSSIPRPLLAAVYSAIGSALLLASARYLKR
ncbi:MAG TPA: hypothetical protein VLR94_08370 [Acidobacteriota bacterium]|nr:hypothetical protein [Acidobacteriota bacterium]